MSKPARAVPTLSRMAENSAETQRRLIAAARALFAERGYAATGTEDLVAAARMTRGALYHHYTDKRDLFRAVFEDVEHDLGTRVAIAAAVATDPWEQMRAATRGFLTACLDPAIRRIVLVDGPSVLGWEEWRRIDTQYSYGMLRTALEVNMACGNLRPLPLDALAHLYVGAMNEAGLAVAAAADPAAAVDQFAATLNAVMEAQRMPARPRRRAAARKRTGTRESGDA